MSRFPNADTYDIDFGIIAGSMCNEIFFIEIAKDPILMQYANAIRDELPRDLNSKEKLSETRKMFQAFIGSDVNVAQEFSAKYEVKLVKLFKQHVIKKMY